MNQYGYSNGNSMLMENSRNSRFKLSLNLDRVIAVLIALLPVIQPLKTPFSVSLSMALLIVMTPLVALRCFKLKSVTYRGLVFVFVFCIFRIVNHGTQVEELLSMLFVMLLSVVLLSNGIALQTYKKTVIFISMLCSVAVIIQFITYYLSGIHIAFLRAEMLRDNLVASYSKQLSTGISTGMYRPSGFLAEPAALSIFALPGLIMLLFENQQVSRKSWRRVIVISAGIVLSTSGMGMALVAGLIVLYVLRRSYKSGRLNRKWTFRLLGIVILGCIAAVAIPQIRNAIIRIFSGFGDNQYSAIRGRMGGGSYYVSLLSGRELLLGSESGIENMTMYLSGIFYIICSEGIVGLILYVCIFMSVALKTKGSVRLLAFLSVLLLLISNLYLIHYMVFYFTPLLGGMGISLKKLPLKTGR